MAHVRANENTKTRKHDDDHGQEAGSKQITEIYKILLKCQRKVLEEEDPEQKQNTENNANTSTNETTDKHATKKMKNQRLEFQPACGAHLHAISRPPQIHTAMQPACNPGRCECSTVSTLQRATPGRTHMAMPAAVDGQQRRVR